MKESYLKINSSSEKTKLFLKKIYEECNSYQTQETEDINKIINYIEENLIVNQENNIDVLSISKIAKSFNFSISSLNDLFNNGCQISIHDYIIKRRMTLASHDLIETKDAIINIALKYGYESPDSFTKAFKKIYNSTPTDYRKKGILGKDFDRFDVKNYDLDELCYVEKNCKTCEFCMPCKETLVCAGRDKEYGFPIEEMIKKYPNGCECFNYSLDAFIENEQKKEKNIKELVNEEAQL